MWEILLNSVLSGWSKLLIIVLARKWVVLLTNCKWAVVNSIRIQKWAVHSYKSQMGYKFSATHLWAYKVDAFPQKKSWRVCKALSTYSQHTVLATVVVGCPSNGCCASSSISDIVASPAQKMIPPPDIWGAAFRKLTCGPNKLTYQGLCQLSQYKRF